MRLREITLRKELGIKITQADVAKMKNINATIQKALKSGNAQDLEAGEGAAKELHNILINKMVPDMMQIGAYIVTQLEKGCATYSKKDPAWAQACKELPQIRTEILRGIHGQGLKPFQGTKKSGEKIVNIFGKSYIVPANAQPTNSRMGIDPNTQNDDLPLVPKEGIGEQTNASSIATVSGNVGTMQSRSMYNADGTMKNGADFGNLLGGKKKSKKTKKA